MHEIRRSIEKVNEGSGPSVGVLSEVAASCFGSEQAYRRAQFYERATATRAVYQRVWRQRVLFVDALERCARALHYLPPDGDTSDPLPVRRVSGVNLRAARPTSAPDVDAADALELAGACLAADAQACAAYDRALASGLPTQVAAVLAAQRVAIAASAELVEALLPQVRVADRR